MKKITLFFTCLLALHFAALSQGWASGASVFFSDGKYYTGKILAETGDRIKIEFLHSHSVYEFDNNGIILSSTGAYPVNTKVKAIFTRHFERDVYNNDIIGEKFGFIGIKFPDGQTYFGTITSVQSNFFIVLFHHSRNYYNIEKEGNIWIVKAKTAGKYPAGTAIMSIYTLGDRIVFYNDGSIIENSSSSETDTE